MQGFLPPDSPDTSFLSSSLSSSFPSLPLPSFILLPGERRKNVYLSVVPQMLARPCGPGQQHSVSWYLLRNAVPGPLTQTHYVEFGRVAFAPRLTVGLTDVPGDQILGDQKPGE